MKAGPGVGLQSALRGLVRQQATIHREWPVERALDAADTAIGGTQLRELYEEWARKQVRPRLDEIWTNLGIRHEETRISFDDEAPLAAVRRAITSVV
jgi:hypothetical protein